MEEHLTKCEHCVALLVDDLLSAHKAANNFATQADQLASYLLLQQLEAARTLQSEINRLSAAYQNVGDGR